MPASPANPEKVLSLLRHRGPDFQSCKQFGKAALYHSRLKIIDTSDASNQPFVDENSAQALVFNGEIFNYLELQKTLPPAKTTGDVEVLFRLLQREGKAALNKLNGFFAFAFYDEREHSLLLARDRFGVKPLYYYRDENSFAFASELKPLLELTGPQELNQDQLYTYFRLNYCTGEETIFKNIYRLLPGQCIRLHNGQVTIETWYQAPLTDKPGDIAALLDDAVKIRLQADVPLGTFLSGGLDSSIISALAKQHKPDLNTFSIGFEKEQYFDETYYSELVAKHIGSNHHVFRLREEDFLQHIDDFLGAIDEPFADSSAFNFYMLSMHTRRHVTVALSGDGADELFKGYNKHKALLMSARPGLSAVTKLAGALLPVKGSRHGKLQNLGRQLQKFNALAELPPAEKQKFLASISDHDTCERLLLKPHSDAYFNALFRSRSSFRHFKTDDSFDLQTVLADDMLVKADRFSMRHGVEIRNPFLDYRIVELALNLPMTQKINKTTQKIILRERFHHLLPQEIFTRAKKGFELPLQSWLSGALRSRLESDWLNLKKIEEQDLLDAAQVKTTLQDLFAGGRNDSAAKTWALLVFESWLQNFKDYIKN